MKTNQVFGIGFLLTIVSFGSAQAQQENHGFKARNDSNPVESNDIEVKNGTILSLFRDEHGLTAEIRGTVVGKGTDLSTVNVRVDIRYLSLFSVGLNKNVAVDLVCSPKAWGCVTNQFKFRQLE
jgi:hypothetical protein